MPSPEKFKKKIKITLKKKKIENFSFSKKNLRERLKNIS